MRTARRESQTTTGKRPAPGGARAGGATPPVWRRLIPAAALFTLVLLSYDPAFRAGFIWDDDAYVEYNVALRSGAGLADIWLRPGTLPQYYPLVFTTFWVEYHLWDLDPHGYHRDN